jgi:hypothetical protein
MAPDSCTVAVEIGDHHITIHFKSDEEFRRIYTHPDNVLMTSGLRSWTSRRGVYTLHQNKYQARASFGQPYQALEEDREPWESWYRQNYGEDLRRDWHVV